MGYYIRMIQMNIIVSALEMQTLGDFTFWISLSLSLFAQSKIRTERKLNQKVKSIFFVRTQSELRTERKTELIVWSEVRTEPEVNLNYSDSVQMNLHARDRLILNFCWAENHFTFSISPNKPNHQEITAKK